MNLGSLDIYDVYQVLYCPDGLFSLALLVSLQLCGRL